MITGLLVALGLAGTAEQDPKPIPTFGARSEAVTLDVVVVDKKGRPVRGLDAADFTILEDGRRQVVLAFEAMDLAVPSPEPGTTASEPGTGNPEGRPPRPRRAFVFLVDDLGLHPARAADVKNAIARWLGLKASPADLITLLDTSGDVSWSGRVDSGREGLLAALGKVQGRKPMERSGMSDGEAYQIAEGTPGALTLLARLVQRGIAAGACFSVPDCEALTRTTAREIHDRTNRRVRAVLGGVERVSLALGPWRGRKAIVVFSESFLRGTSPHEEEAAVRASQRANTAVYLVNARNLGAESLYGPEVGDAPDPTDLGPLTRDQDLLFSAGEYLAEATGGRTLRNTNDLASGLERILDESNAYYLLGFQPERAPDGRWRKLEVKVGRRKLEVRARRGYYASPAVAEAAAAPPAAEPLAKADPRPPVLAPEREPVISPDPVLGVILEKAGAYVVAYGQAFRDVVAEESYTQWLGGNRRYSRSDLVFVSMPGAISWTCFRDVFEVDGLRVRDRESRLEKLFLTDSRASAMQKATAIIREGARYNLGWPRTINVPTLPLLFLHPANQERFRFVRKGRHRFGDKETVEIALLEMARPTLVNDGEGGDVPASGRVFVDPASGAILRTDVTFRLLRHPGDGRLVTAYRFDPGLGLLLPEEMKESYHHLSGKFVPEVEQGVFYGDTEATASYAKYRRFGVTTEERVALPPR